MSISELQSTPSPILSYVSPYLRDSAKPSDDQTASTRQKQAVAANDVTNAQGEGNQPNIGFAVAGGRSGASINIVV